MRSATITLFMNHICSILARIARRLNSLQVKAFQLPLALLSLGWAIVLAPKDDMEHSIYGVFSLVAPEWAWAVMLAAIGGAQLFGFLTDSRRVSRMALYFSTAVWTFVACLLLLLTEAITGFIAYGLFAGMSAWALAQSNGAARNGS